MQDIREGEPKIRFAKATQQLISFAFPSLRMLKGIYDETTLAKTLLDRDDLIFGADQSLSEAEQEVLMYVTRNQNTGELTSIEEMIRSFGRRPTGWYAMAVVNLVARLFRMTRVELRAPELLDAGAALELLKNSRKHGGIRVRLQELIPPGRVDALRAFHHDFFDQANAGTDARSVGQATLTAFAGESYVLAGLAGQSSRYSFLKPLGPLAERLAALGARDHTYLLNHLNEFKDELLTAKEDLLSPVKTFMNGPQRTAYDEAMAFLRAEEANFAELPEAEVKPLRTLEAAPHPYRGNVVPLAKAAVARLRGLLEERLKDERTLALDQVEAQTKRLQSTDDFVKLAEADRAKVMALTETARTNIRSARFMTGIRDLVQRYLSRDYPAQLALASKLAAVTPPLPPMEGDGEETPPPPPPSPAVHYTPVSTLRPVCGLPYIASGADLEQWLSALRLAAEAELKKGHRISL